LATIDAGQDGRNEFQSQVGNSDVFARRAVDNLFDHQPVDHLFPFITGDSYRPGDHISRRASFKKAGAG
jgi:hypothetical protein